MPGVRKTARVPADTDITCVCFCVCPCVYECGGAKKQTKSECINKREDFRVTNAINKIKQSNVIMPARAILEWMII